MNDEEVSLNEHFIWAQKRIKELNQDRRSDVMDYEMKMMDREIYGREIGEKRGKEIGEKIGKEAERRAGIKKLIATVMSFTVDEDVIFNKVKEQYGEYFSDDEIKQFIVAVKKSIPVE